MIPYLSQVHKYLLLWDQPQELLLHKLFLIHYLWLGSINTTADQAVVTFITALLGKVISTWVYLGIAPIAGEVLAELFAVAVALTIPSSCATTWRDGRML